MSVNSVSRREVVHLLQSIAKSQMASKVSKCPVFHVRGVNLQQYIELIVAKVINRAFRESCC